MIFVITWKILAATYNSETMLIIIPSWTIIQMSETQGTL